MARIEVDNDRLTVHIEGLDRLWTLKTRLEVPLAHVISASVAADAMRRRKGWRGPGAHIPGVIVAGTYHLGGERVFWDVHHKERAIVVELAHDTYQKLVVEVEDPAATVQLIERAVARP